MVTRTIPPSRASSSTGSLSQKQRSTPVRFSFPIVCSARCNEKKLEAPAKNVLPLAGNGSGGCDGSGAAGVIPALCSASTWKSGALVPNLENQVFVLSAYADGKPAAAGLKVRADGNPDQSVTTDEGGVAVIRLTAASQPRALQVEAMDREGNRTSQSLPLQTRGGAEQVMLGCGSSEILRTAVYAFTSPDRGASCPGGAAVSVKRPGLRARGMLVKTEKER